MKKIFSIFLVCCTAFAFANDEPVFEETDEETNIGSYLAFSAEEPIFEEDDESETCRGSGCEETDDQDPISENDQDPRAESEQDPRAESDQDPISENDQDPIQQDDGKAFINHAVMMSRLYTDKKDESRFAKASYVSWKRFKANFGVEKLFVRFPQRPAVTQSNTLLTAYAYDHAVLYALTGFYPPYCCINPGTWFNDILFCYDAYPFNLISQPVIFQDSDTGYWYMDYVVHDCVQDLIIKARSVVTPYNAYTIQCVKPNGCRDHFDYFLDSCWIKCDCN